MSEHDCLKKKNFIQSKMKLLIQWIVQMKSKYDFLRKSIKEKKKINFIFDNSLVLLTLRTLPLTPHWNYAININLSTIDKTLTKITRFNSISRRKRK